MAEAPGTNIVACGDGSAEGGQEGHSLSTGSEPTPSPVPVLDTLISIEEPTDPSQFNCANKVGTEDDQVEPQPEEIRHDEKEDEMLPSEIGQNDNQEESHPFVGREPDSQKCLLAQFVDFCKKNRGAILIALVALATVAFPVWVGVARSNTSVLQNDQLLSLIDKMNSQNDEMLSRLPDATTTQELDAYKTELDTTKKKLAESNHENTMLQEKLSVINQTACVDLGSIGDPIVLCDFMRCVEGRLDGEEAYFHVPGNFSLINYSETEWFPVDCLNWALTEFSCFTVRGRRALKDWRKHSKCPGKRQYQCLSSGMNPTYFRDALKRDVHAEFKTCPILSMP